MAWHDTTSVWSSLVTFRSTNPCYRAWCVWSCASLTCSLFYFNPRTRNEGATTLLVGGTRQMIQSATIHYDHVHISLFQSTHPCGCNPGYVCDITKTEGFQSTHPCGVRHVSPFASQSAHHSNPRTRIMGARYPCRCGAHQKRYFNPRTHKYRHDSTFLYCYGLIGSHVVPIAHSVLSGLDNGPYIKPWKVRSLMCDGGATHQNFLPLLYHCSIMKASENVNS